MDTDKGMGFATSLATRKQRWPVHSPELSQKGRFSGRYVFARSDPLIHPRQDELHEFQLALTCYHAGGEGWKLVSKHSPEGGNHEAIAVRILIHLD